MGQASTALLPEYQTTGVNRRPRSMASRRAPVKRRSKTARLETPQNAVDPGHTR